MGKTFLYLAYTALMRLFAEGPNKYCDLNCPGKIHVRCENGEGILYDEPHDCTNVNAKYLTKDEVIQILDFHNEKRRLVARGKEVRGNGGHQPGAVAYQKIPELEWDNELAGLAQQLANQCTQWHKYKCSDTENYKVGQNVIHSTGDGYVSLESQLNEWYNEVDRFDPKNVQHYRYDEATRRYAQMVAAKTTKIGCGYIRASWNTYDASKPKGKKYPRKWHTRLVCNYGPDGLVDGEPLYQTEWDVNIPFTEVEYTTIPVYYIDRPKKS